jgi:hypothetical protein
MITLHVNLFGKRPPIHTCREEMILNTLEVRTLHYVRLYLSTYKSRYSPCAHFCMALRRCNSAPSSCQK